MSCDPMLKLLTIIIPTYNMQNFLHRCLDSLIVPLKLLEQVEVLVVNDGSKDNSSAIGHEYESRYPDTFRVIDKENGNYGSCVNRGLAEAHGKYIKVLDADDWFDTEAFVTYLGFLEDTDVDMVLTPYNIVDAKTGETSASYHPNLEEGKVYRFSDCSYDDVGVYMMHAVTYRVAFLRSISYTQTEGISYTDTEWTYNPLYAVETMAFCNCNVYQYLVGREGQTMDPKVMVKTINHHEIITKSLIHGLQQNHPEGFGKLTVERQVLYLLKMIYRIRLVQQDADAFDAKAMSIFDQYIKDQRPDMYRQISSLLLKPWFPIPYIAFWRLTGRRFPVDGMKKLYRKIRERHQ